MTAEAVLCGVAESACVCVEDAGHDGPHVCDCLGSWEYDADGEFRPLTFPGGPEASMAGMLEVIDRMTRPW